MHGGPAGTQPGVTSARLIQVLLLECVPGAATQLQEVLYEEEDFPLGTHLTEDPQS